MDVDAEEAINMTQGGVAGERGGGKKARREEKVKGKGEDSHNFTTSHVRIGAIK